MSDHRPPDDNSWPAGLLAGKIALIVIGLLMLVPCGLCTGAFVIGGLTGGGLELAGMALIIGFIPIAIGAALLTIGLRIRRDG